MKLQSLKKEYIKLKEDLEKERAVNAQYKDTIQVTNYVLLI